VNPVARGGVDDAQNIVITSMLNNAAKANWRPDELGWRPGDAPLISGWDGLLGWFVSEYERGPILARHQALTDWYKAAKAAPAAMALTVDRAKVTGGHGIQRSRPGLG
jgi:hypothetical protein